jgi:flagellar motor protein MotB
MRMARRLIFGLVGITGLLGLVSGCENPDKQRALSLQDKVNQLQAENDDLRSRLAAATSERDQWRNRAAALEQENANLRRELAKQPTGGELPPGWKGTKEFAWKEIGTDVLFDSGKASLKSAAHAKLQQVVTDINQNFPDRMIWVLGHTDSDPIKVSHWKDNLDLSCNRGMTVYRELMKMGVDPKRMLAGGQGEYYPVASNATRAGKQQNRRVEFIVVPPRPTPAGGSPEVAAPEQAAPPPK